MTFSFPDMAKKTRNIVGTGKAYFNRRGGKNKHSSSQKPPARTRRKKRRNKKGLLYNRCG